MKFEPKPVRQRLKQRLEKEPKVVKVKCEDYEASRIYRVAEDYMCPIGPCKKADECKFGHYKFLWDRCCWGDFYKCTICGAEFHSKIDAKNCYKSHYWRRLKKWWKYRKDEKIMEDFEREVERRKERSHNPRETRRTRASRGREETQGW